MLSITEPYIHLKMVKKLKFYVFFFNHNRKGKKQIELVIHHLIEFKLKNTLKKILFSFKFHLKNFMWHKIPSDKTCLGVPAPSGEAVDARAVLLKLRCAYK